MAHCRQTIPTAHLAPNSRFITEIAAMHGVYSKQNTRNEAADNGVSILPIPAPPTSTFSVETTLSFAIKPAMRAVDILQSPNPRGAKIGAINPAIIASMLVLEPLTTFNPKSNVCRNHIFNKYSIIEYQ